MSLSLGHKGECPLTYTMFYLAKNLGECEMYYFIWGSTIRYYVILDRFYSLISNAVHQVEILSSVLLS